VTFALLCQVLLLVYHQLTTFIDLAPFNGAKKYSRTERAAEMGVNAVLMSLAPFGFAFHIHGLMLFGVVYYFVLFAIELIIWWVPYLMEPRGRWRALYNFALAAGTSDFQRGDTLDRWQETYRRLHAGTITILPRRESRVVPNVEHMLLHALTLITAVATAVDFHARSTGGAR
jgi:hypothetical protein